MSAPLKSFLELRRLQRNNEANMGLLRAFLKNSEGVILAILSLIGFLTGQLAYNSLMVHKVVYPLLKTPSFALYCYVSPLIIFMTALDTDFHILRKVLWQISFTGLVAFSVVFVITGTMVMKFNKESWDLQCCLLFSMAVVFTDPTHVASLLKTSGIPKMYTDVIRGESMIICGIVYIVFGMFRSHLLHLSEFMVFIIFMDFILTICGSIIFGYLCSRIIQFTLTDLFNNRQMVVICISVVYMTFYIVELFNMSGMVALITAGLKLHSLNFKPKMELVTKFLITFSSILQHLMYTFFGIVIGCGGTNSFGIHTVTFSLILYVTVNFARLLTLLLVTPFLMYLSHDYNWRWGVVITWYRIIGVFNLLLAPEIYNLVENKTVSPYMFLFYIQMVSLMTMGINSYMMTHLAGKLGMCAISLLRQMDAKHTIKHMQEIIQNTITLFKTEKLLTNVNWTVTEEKVRIRYNIPFDVVPFQHILPRRKEQESPIDQVLTEEARVHVAVMQMRSFEKQCNDGVLDTEAAQILIGATKSYCTIRGKFMSIHDVSTYVKARSWLGKFKNILTVLEYHKDKAHFIPPMNNKFLICIYHLVFSEEFEYAGHIISFMYICPMIMHLWPIARELNVLALILINYCYVFLYVLQSTLKVLFKIEASYKKNNSDIIIILKRKYFYQLWNTLEFFIMLFGIADLFCIYFVKSRPEKLVLIEITIIIGYFRIIRFIPLVKVIIPLLINMVGVQIKKQMKKHVSLMYSITKGYIKSQDDTKFLIKQMFCQDSIYQKLYEILETYQYDAVKELGLMEHKDHDVVIAVKTKQAIHTVIVGALKHLSFLWSRGIVDKQNRIEMKKVLLSKIKALNNFPVTIPPPAPEKYLHYIVWLENKDVLIEFFKERAKLTYFDYGDVICKEGEMPQGIYLIISGMAKLLSSPPSFGIDSSFRIQRESQTIFTEYCTCGAIIGELSCLLMRENEYTAICETILEAYFISLEDLYEGFDAFWPSLENKIWLKLALSMAHQYFESVLIDEDLDFQKCVMLNLAYVETLLGSNEMTIDKNTMKFVIVMYGSVRDARTKLLYFAPCILPKACEQVKGTSDLNKLLVIQAPHSVKSDNYSKDKGPAASGSSQPGTSGFELVTSAPFRAQVETEFRHRKGY